VAEEQVADVSGSPEGAPSAIMNADAIETATETGSWRDQLPDDLRDHQSLQNITDVGALAKTMIHAQSMVGAEKIPIPGKWATDDDWAEVYQKLGRPDDADGYAFDFGDVKIDDDFVSGFSEVAHKAGLSERQAKALAGWYMEQSPANASDPEEQARNIEAAKTDAVADLRKEYGNAFQDRLKLGDNLMAEFGGEGLLELRLADGTPLVNNPAFAKMIINTAHWINESVSEDKLIGEKGSGAITPGEADEKLRELMREDGPYWDSRSPHHDSYVKQVLELHEQKHPNELA